MIKKGLNKHPGGKKKPVNLDQTQIKKYIQAETGVVISSLDRDSKTVFIGKTTDLAKVEATLGKTVGGWTVKPG